MMYPLCGLVFQVKICVLHAVLFMPDYQSFEYSSWELLGKLDAVERMVSVTKSQPKTPKVVGVQKQNSQVL